MWVYMICGSMSIVMRSATNVVYSAQFTPRVKWELRHFIALLVGLFGACTASMNIAAVAVRHIPAPRAAAAPPRLSHGRRTRAPAAGTRCYALPCRRRRPSLFSTAVALLCVARPRLAHARGAACAPQTSTLLAQPSIQPGPPAAATSTSVPSPRAPTAAAAPRAPTGAPPVGGTTQVLAAQVAAAPPPVKQQPPPPQTQQLPPRTTAALHPHPHPQQQVQQQVQQQQVHHEMLPQPAAGPGTQQASEAEKALSAGTRKRWCSAEDEKLKMLVQKQEGKVDWHAVTEQLGTHRAVQAVRQHHYIMQWDSDKDRPPKSEPKPPKPGPQPRGRPKKGMKWNSESGVWELDPDSKDEPRKPSSASRPRATPGQLPHTGAGRALGGPGPIPPPTTAEPVQGPGPPHSAPLPAGQPHVGVAAGAPPMRSSLGMAPEGGSGSVPWMPPSQLKHQGIAHGHAHGHPQPPVASLPHVSASHQMAPPDLSRLQPLSAHTTLSHTQIAAAAVGPAPVTAVLPPHGGPGGLPHAIHTSHTMAATAHPVSSIPPSMLGPQGLTSTAAAVTGHSVGSVGSIQVRLNSRFPVRYPALSFIPGLTFGDKWRADGGSAADAGGCSAD